MASSAVGASSHLRRQRPLRLRLRMRLRLRLLVRLHMPSPARQTPEPIRADRSAAPSLRAPERSFPRPRAPAWPAPRLPSRCVPFPQFPRAAPRPPPLLPPLQSHQTPAVPPTASAVSLLAQNSSVSAPPLASLRSLTCILAPGPYSHPRLPCRANSCHVSSLGRPPPVSSSPHPAAGHAPASGAPESPDCPIVAPSSGTLLLCMLRHPIRPMHLPI